MDLMNKNNLIQKATRQQISKMQEETLKKDTETQQSKALIETDLNVRASFEMPVNHQLINIMDDNGDSYTGSEISPTRLKSKKQYMTEGMTINLILATENPDTQP